MWISEEIGAGQDIGAFAKTFAFLFGGEAPSVLRTKCLKIFAIYSGRQIHSEASLPPLELEDFLNALLPKQADLCRECGKVLPEALKEYCSEKCRHAGIKYHCKKCKGGMVRKKLPSLPDVQLGRQLPLRPGWHRGRAGRQWARRGRSCSTSRP